MAVVHVLHVLTAARVVAEMGDVHTCKPRTRRTRSHSFIPTGNEAEAQLESAGTSLPGRHLARHARHVTVKSRPASPALAGVVGPALPTLSSVLTGRRFTPRDQILNVVEKKKKKKHKT